MSTRPIAPALLALASLHALGCAGQDPVQPSTIGGASPAATVAAAWAAPGASAVSDLPPFDPRNFVRGVDNPLFPLPLGRRLIYKGREDGEPETVITDVTRDRKTILGVPVVVVLDRVFQSGQLTEKTFDWYAQDRQGNVWYFGEDTKEFESGRVVSTAGSFEVGKHGARAGIIMRAHPQARPDHAAGGRAGRRRGQIADPRGRCHGEPAVRHGAALH